jgi:hypothetical protein
MERPHPTVVQFIQGFDPKLTVRKNPEPEDPYWHRWYVCQPVLRMYPIDDDLGLCLVLREEEPVLTMPDGYETDNRVVRALDENRWENIEDAELVVKRQRQKVIHDASDEAEAWAKDKGYWYFKKSIEPYNLALMPKGDPHYKMKEWEDRHGQEYLGDKPY